MNYTYLTLGAISFYTLGLITNRMRIKYITLQTNKEIENIINDIIDNIDDKNTRFVNRINNTIFIETSIKNYGNISIAYIIDNNDIFLYKGKELLLGSESILKQYKELIAFKINTIYEKDINDVIDILGVIMSKKDFETKIKTLSPLSKNRDFGIIDIDMGYKMMNIDENPNIDSNENIDLNIDSILDRINLIGYDNLTEIEKEYLNNIKKK